MTLKRGKGRKHYKKIVMHATTAKKIGARGTHESTAIGQKNRKLFCQVLTRGRPSKVKWSTPKTRR